MSSSSCLASSSGCGSLLRGRRAFPRAGCGGRPAHWRCSTATRRGLVARLGGRLATRTALLPRARDGRRARKCRRVGRRGPGGNRLAHLEPLPNDALRELLLVARLEDIFALPLAAGHLVVIRVDVVLAHASHRCMTCATRPNLAGRDTSAGAPGGGAAITTKATYKKPFLSGFLWGCRRATWGRVRGGRRSPIR